MPHLLLQHHQRDRGDPARRLRVVHRHIAATQQQHPQPLRPDPLGLSGGRRRRIEQHIGRADHPVAVVAVGHAAPLGGRLERCCRRGDPAGRAVIRLGDRLHAGVGAGVGGGQRGQHVGDGLLPRPQFLDVRDPHAVFGQRAGLVGADHVDAGQSLDRGQLLHQALALTEPDDADRERDRRHQHQALGHHRHQRTHHPQHGLPPPRVRGEQLGVDRQQPGRHQQVGDELQNPVNAIAQFGFHQGELAGLLGQLGGIGVRTHLGGAVGTGAGDDEAARHHRGANSLGDRIRLTRQQRFVDLQVVLLDDLAVDDDLVPGAELDDVIEHHLAGQQRCESRIACAPTVSPARRSPACPASAWPGSPGPCR